jgi:hypothetical protein
MSQLIEDRVQQGRDAYRRHAWHDAVASLREADSETALSPEDLALLAEAAWFAGDPDAAIEARERAHAGYLEQGDKCRAAEMALQLAASHSDRLETAIANGWFGRAKRLLEQTTHECAAHGWQATSLAYMRSAPATPRKHSVRQSWRKTSANESPDQRFNSSASSNRAMPWSPWAVLRMAWP